jgi:tetrahydromethanopterin S-methyltransferase subunit G
MNSSDVKKRLRDFVNRITVDFDDFNHMSQINRKLDEVEKLVEYIENKIILRIEKAHVEATPSKKSKVKTNESDAGTDAPSDDGGSDRGE